MLSILIPTKDYECYPLVEQLHKQGEKLGCDYEIIVGEDGSRPDALIANRRIETLTNCRRMIRIANVGRANIRNLLAEEAKYPYILFIDSDAVVEKEDFLAYYIKELEKNDVVCGGLYHADILEDKECSLRYRYEKKADKSRDAETRNKRPYDQFTTFNFAIKKELFLSIKFNPAIMRYGYEDTLFGKELEKRGIKIKHVDNKLLHNGLDNNSIFLSKIENSLITLSEIEEVIGTTPLLSTASRLDRTHLAKPYILIWKTFRQSMVKNLTGKKPSLTILNLYKLGFFLLNRKPIG